MLLTTIASENEIESEKKLLEDVSDGKILWKVNNSRFHREFRDQLIVQAVQRRIDSSAGNLMRIVLKLMNEKSARDDAYSAHIHQVSIDTGGIVV